MKSLIQLRKAEFSADAFRCYLGEKSLDTPSCLNCLLLYTGCKASNITLNERWSTWFYENWVHFTAEFSQSNLMVGWKKNFMTKNYYTSARYKMSFNVTWNKFNEMQTYGRERWCFNNGWEWNALFFLRLEIKVSPRLCLSKVFQWNRSSCKLKNATWKEKNTYFT